MRDPWALYDGLIEGVPRGIAVTGWCLGTRWAYVDAECGMGLSLTVNGGVGRYGLADADNNRDLHELATYAKSWNFREASVGVAAMNAWYSTPDRLARAGVQLDAMESRGDDAFRVCRPRLRGRKVAVIGHFPSSVVLDPPRVRRLVERGAAMLFGEGVRMVHLERERAWSL